MVSASSQSDSIRARDIMTHEPICVEPGACIHELARVLEENGVSGCPVVNAEGRLIGVVSKSDLFRRCSEGAGGQPPGYLFELLMVSGGGAEPIPERLVVVEDFMSSNPVTARPDESIAVLARRMSEASIHRIIVVSGERVPIGIVTSLDLLRAFPGA